MSSQQVDISQKPNYREERNFYFWLKGVAIKDRGSETKKEGKGKERNKRGVDMKDKNQKKNGNE